MTLSKEALADIMQHYPAPLVGLAIGDALGAPFEKPSSKSHIVDQDLLTWKGSTATLVGATTTRKPGSGRTTLRCRSRSQGLW
jgi:hypothetical protein